MNRPSLSSIIIAITLLLGIHTAKAQQTYFLSVDSIAGIPDTIYDGQAITFTMVFSNQSNLGFQGDVTTWLQTQGTADSIQADSTTWGASFIQAQSQTQVTVTHVFESQNSSLSIGDNVVVVWPRINSGPVFPPQEVTTKGTVHFYLAQPNGIDSPDDGRIGRLGLFPNPAQGTVRITLPESEILNSVRITDMMGRTVFESASMSTSVAIDTLPHGIYTVHATTAKGQPYAARLVVRP